MDSLWSAGVTAERFFPQGSLSSEDQGLIDRIGPEDSFDAAQVMLQRVIGIMSHWKPKWGQQREDLAKQQQELAKREQELAKQEQELAKVKGRLQPWKEANKILREDNKALTAALDEAKRREAELRTARSDLARVQKSLEIALRSNEAYASRVGELQGLAAFSRARARSLEDEVTSSRDQVRVLEDVVASLKGELAAAAEERLRSEAILGGREDEIAALRVELVELAAGKAAVEGRLVEMERSVVAEHKRGFQKAARQARLLAPGFDFSSMHVEKVVRRGRIVSEDDVNDSSSENASA
ncbi:coiled-coil domain-containing protein 57-like [Cajanus cajan]|uniref:coiled-coil domain-containing protein 57-like n=1 Tax=Cajanus cajan TaxID=3821 RepID=UPI0010FAEDFE|nr:coiled-coil domain-containing protein 57-like [Cajanus cajan]